MSHLPPPFTAPRFQRYENCVDFGGEERGGREKGSPVPLSDEAGVRVCKAFVSRLCMGAGAWVIMWVDISAVVCVHGKCALDINYRLGQRLPVGLDTVMCRSQCSLNPVCI